MTRIKPKQIMKLLRKADEEQAKCKSEDGFCREEQISPSIYYLWQRRYVGLQGDDAKRFETLEE